jgi:hypothetical protein
MTTTEVATYTILKQKLLNNIAHHGAVIGDPVKCATLANALETVCRAEECDARTAHFIKSTAPKVEPEAVAS